MSSHYQTKGKVQTNPAKDELDQIHTHHWQGEIFGPKKVEL